MHLTSLDLILAAITLVAATVNGGLGYGFSSISVPLALLWVSNQVLSPALVLVEIFINLVAMAVNARALPQVFRRVLPLLAGVLPGAVLGTFALRMADPGLLRLAIYAVLLPLVLLQVAGVRRPLRREPLAGAGVGALYAATTISGPPLSLLLSNQGYTKDHFRAALALFRTVESLITGLLYLSLGLFTAESLRISTTVAPSVLVGIPLGYLLLRRLPNETFRKLCLGADVLIVGFGLLRALARHSLLLAAAGGLAVSLLVALLWRRTRSLETAEARS